MGCIWYPHYIGDYMKKTGHLSLTEHGAYRVLMDHYYSSGKPLPANEAKMHRLCRAHADFEKAAVSAVLSEFFYIADGFYRNDRVDAEIQRADRRSETQAERARKGWATRKGLADAPQEEPVEYPNEHVKAIFGCEIFRGVNVETVATIVHNNMENPRFKTNLEEFLGDAANVIVSGAELPRDWNPPTKKLRSYLSSSGPMSGAKGKEKRTVQFE